MTIPLVDVHSQYAPLIPELEARFREVLDGGQFIRGPHFYAFQEEAAAYLGVKQAIGVANGTDALVLVLDALEIGPGDEVICPAFTFYATAESIARRGATPVFADIDPVTLNLDPEDVAAKMTSRTRAIMPVHLFGRPAALDELSQLGVPLIEDAAQAFGAPGVAQHGVVSTYSFFPTKNLFCLGDGGLVVSNDEDLADRVRVLAFHGSRDKTDFDFVGYNSRLDELQASFLRLFLTHLDEWNRGRREAAARYAELGLGDLLGRVAVTAVLLPALVVALEVAVQLVGVLERIGGRQDDRRDQRVVGFAAGFPGVDGDLRGLIRVLPPMTRTKHRREVEAWFAPLRDEVS